MLSLHGVIFENLKKFSGGKIKNNSQNRVARAQWKECRRMEVTAPTAFTKPVDEHSGVARDADGLLGDLRVEKREASMMVEQSGGASCG